MEKRIANQCMTVMTNANKTDKGGRPLLSDDDIIEIAEALNEARTSARLDEAIENVGEAITRKAEDEISNIRRNADIAKRNAYINIVRENGIMSQIKLAFEMRGDPSLGIKAVLVGDNSPFPGAARSVAALTQALSRHYTGQLIRRMKNDGVYIAYQNMSGDLEKQTARMLSHYNTPGPERDLIDVSNISSDAKKIAKIMYDMQLEMVGRQNRAGADITRKSGYVIRQQHDPRRMIKAGFGAWKTSIQSKLDWAKMEILPENWRDASPEQMKTYLQKQDDFLESTWQAVTTGKRKEFEGDTKPIAKAFKGPTNLAGKISESRLLQFEDVDGWYDYDQVFGKASLTEAFMDDINGASRNIALMERLGTNPEAMVERVVKRAGLEYRDVAPKRQVDKLNMEGGPVQVFTIKAALDEVTGDINFGSHTDAAAVGHMVRSIETMAKLGMAVISALSDVAFIATNRMYHGRSIMGAWHDAFTAVFKGRKGSDMLEFAELMGVGFDSQLGGITARFSAADNMPGTMSKMVNKYFQLNQLGPWSDAAKRGVTFMISNDLARNANKAFADLPEDLSRLLTMYGINAKQWEVGRNAVKLAPDGRKYMLPGDVDTVSGAVFDGMSKHQQQRLKDTTKENLFALFVTEADYSVPSPGAKEQAIMRRGYRPGTLAGEAVRFVGQFKSFSVTALSKVGGRQAYGYGAKTFGEQLKRGPGANIGLMNTIVGTTIMGYFALQAKELAKGREPKPITPQTFFDAMAQGGALGLYGDFLFSETNRYGQSLTDSLIGPALGDLSNIGEAALGIGHGDFDKSGRKLLRTAENLIPAQNVPIVGDLFDYLFVYGLNESISPGFLQKKEADLKKRTGQDYLISPRSLWGN